MRDYTIARLGVGTFKQDNVTCLTCDSRVVTHLNGDRDAWRRQQTERRRRVDGNGRTQHHHRRLCVAARRFRGFGRRFDKNRRRLGHANWILLFQSASEAPNALQPIPLNFFFAMNNSSIFLHQICGYVLNDWMDLNMGQSLRLFLVYVRPFLISITNKVAISSL